MEGSDMAMLMPLFSLDAAGPKVEPEVKVSRDGQGLFLGVLESAFAGGAQANSSQAGVTLLDDSAATPAGEDDGKEKDGKGADSQDALAGAMAGLVAAAAALPVACPVLPKAACPGQETAVAEDAPAQSASGPSIGPSIGVAGLTGLKTDAAANDKGAAVAATETVQASLEAAIPEVAPVLATGVGKPESASPAAEKANAASVATAAVPVATAAAPGEVAVPQAVEAKTQEMPVISSLAADVNNSPSAGKETKINTKSEGPDKAPQSVSGRGPDGGGVPVDKIIYKADAVAVGGPVQESGRQEAGKPAHPAPAAASPGPDSAPVQTGQAKAGNFIGGVAADHAPAKGGGDVSRASVTAPAETARKAAMPKATAEAAMPDITPAKMGQGQVEAAEEAQPPAHTVKEGVLAQFSDGFNSLLKRGGDGVVIRLSPPSLGKIKIEVVTHGQEIRAKVTADNSDVRDILSGNQSSLRSSMHDAGLSLREFSVGVDGGGADGRWAWAGTGTGSGAGGRPSSGVREGAAPEAGKGPEEPTGPPAGVYDRSRLHLVV